MDAMRAIGLVTLGFLLGIVVSQLEFTPDSQPYEGAMQPSNLQVLDWVGKSITFNSVNPTGRWRLLSRENYADSAVAVVVDNKIRFVIHDDGHSSYYTVYDDSSTTWQGRLIDFGNNGRIEVADITNGHCEQFDPIQN